MSAVIGAGSGAADWAAKYQGTPIFLAGGTGIAANGDISIFTYTDRDPQPDVPAFAQYKPVSGSSLLRNAISTFPFANQAVAANAIIQQPTKLSMEMLCPVQGGQSWAAKLATLTGLVQTVKQHSNLGGLFNLMTPAFPYTNGILIDLRDVSQGETLQPQYKYVWDFDFPLITLDQAQQVLNTLLNKIDTGAAPGPAVPTVGTALAATNTTAPELSSTLTNQLSPQLQAAGLPTAQLPAVVASSVQVAIAGNFSPLDLATTIACQYLPATQAVGMSTAAALSFFSSNVYLVMAQIGAGPRLMANLLKASLGSVVIPGNFAPNSVLA